MHHEGDVPQTAVVLVLILILILIIPVRCIPVPLPVLLVPTSPSAAPSSSASHRRGLQHDAGPAAQPAAARQRVGLVLAQPRKVGQQAPRRHPLVAVVKVPLQPWPPQLPPLLSLSLLLLLLPSLLLLLLSLGALRPLSCRCVATSGGGGG